MFILAFHASLRIGEITVLSTNTANPNLLNTEQLEVKDTSMTVKLCKLALDPNSQQHRSPLPPRLPSSAHEDKPYGAG